MQTKVKNNKIYTITITTDKSTKVFTFIHKKHIFIISMQDNIYSET